MAPLEDSAVSSWITDTLRSRDGKRAVGCLEIEQRFRELAQSSDVAGAAQLTRLLVLNIKTPAEGQPTPPAWIRVGAIVSCASAAVGLGREMTTEVLVPEAMKHLTARLREVGDGVALAACEAVYNIARIVRGDIVDYVPGIVEALCFLSASAMGSLQQACGVLNRLAMDLVCECRDWGGVSKPGGESLLHRIVAVTIAGLRGGVEAGVCFSLDWVSVLESSPDIGQELLEGYPELIKVLHSLHTHILLSPPPFPPPSYSLLFHSPTFSPSISLLLPPSLIFSPPPSSCLLLPPLPFSSVCFGSSHISSSAQSLLSSDAYSIAQETPCSFLVVTPYLSLVECTSTTLTSHPPINSVPAPGLGHYQNACSP